MTKRDLEKYYDRAINWVRENHIEELNNDSFIYGVIVAMKKEDERGE